MNHSTWRRAGPGSLRVRRWSTTRSTSTRGWPATSGQAVYDRRIELGLSQNELAERAGVTQPQVSRMEGGDTVPTLPLLRSLAKALDGTLNLAVDEGNSRVTFTPHTA